MGDDGRMKGLAGMDFGMGYYGDNLLVSLLYYYQLLCMFMCVCMCVCVCVCV